MALPAIQNNFLSYVTKDTETPKATSKVSQINSTPAYPSKITLRWLYEHVPIKFYIAIAAIVVTIFFLGLGAGKVGLQDYLARKFFAHSEKAPKTQIQVTPKSGAPD